MMSNLKAAFNLLILLGSVSRIQSDPVPSGFDGYGDSSSGSSFKSIGSSNSRYDQEYPGSYGSRRDFDEGHKEDIEQESIKYHSLVNKALNTAKDADRFVGDSIKEQEKSQKDYPRLKRSVVPLAPSAKRNFRPLSSVGAAVAAQPVAAPVAAAPVAAVASAAAAPVAAASVQQPIVAAKPLARQQGPSGGPAEEEVVGDNALPQSVAATGGEEDYGAGGDAEGGAAGDAKASPDESGDLAGAGGEAGTSKGGRGAGGEAGKGSGGDINPEKVDEMIDLMNSLNQKFAQMIANWDDYAANQSEGTGGAGGTGGAEEMGSDTPKKKPLKQKGSPSKGGEGADYEEPEEAEEAEGGTGGGSGQRRLRQLPHIL